MGAEVAVAADRVGRYGLPVSVVLSDGGKATLRVDCWSWGAFHAVVSVAHVLPDATWIPLRFNDGGSLTAREVIRLAGFVDAVLLPCMRPGERLMLDGTVTRKKPSFAVQTDEAEAWKDYSVSHEVVVGILDFLRTAEGPVRVR